MSAASFDIASGTQLCGTCNGLSVGAVRGQQSPDLHHAAETCVHEVWFTHMPRMVPIRWKNTASTATLFFLPLPAPFRLLWSISAHNAFCVPPRRGCDQCGKTCLMYSDQSS